MSSLVVVEPLADAWAVRCALTHNPMMFATGAQAEHAARALAHRLAEAGEPVVLEIRLRDGARAGRFLFPPRLHADIASHGASARRSEGVEALMDA